MQPDDRRTLTLRISALQYLVATAFAALAVSFWMFQIANHEQFRDMAQNNHMRRLPLPAPRGVLFDRSGKVPLVHNKDILNIVLVREQTKDVDQTLVTLAEATGVDVNQLREIVERRRRDPSYRPIVLIENASEAQVIAMSARAMELPGIDYHQVPARQYDNNMAAHLFGYVGEINETQLTRADYKDLGAGAIIGQAGVEQAYNKLLMGTDGYKAVVVNSRGREIRPLYHQPPREGNRLRLTVDADLQKAAEEAFAHFGVMYSGKPYNGAAVVFDPNSGEVLTLVSLPAYDPNKFAVGLDSATWRSLITDKAKPLSNRALQSTYSPGSTFKLVVATAAMEEGIATPEFRVNCPGGANFYGRWFQCHLKGGHGTLDMRHAIEKSCNTYFYTLGNMLGVDRIHKWATALGLGQVNGIDLPNEIPGLVPSTEWKRREKKEKWYAGETISVAIGQGQVNVTPMSLAVMMMTIANGGTRHTPHVVQAVDTGRGWEPLAAPPPRSSVHLKESTIKALRDGLWLAVNGAGTAGRARIEGRDVAGKTGTAQVISLTGAERARGKIDVRDHGWFVFFASRDKPELAGVIFAEHAEHGYYGASIAKHIIQTYYAKKEGKPLPQLELPPATTVVAEVPQRPVPVRRAGGD